MLSKRTVRHILPAIALLLPLAAWAQDGDDRTRTLAEGTPLLAGVTLEEATPIADILADPDTWDGKLVQVEGTVVAICSNMGCWAALEDADGNRLNVKVEDGVVDFRELTDLQHHMVAEGVFQKVGEHGAQVFIMGHGAVLRAPDGRP